MIKQDKIKWIQNRLKKKYKIKPEVTLEVLSAIGDLEWDWKNSRYDLFGFLCNLDKELKELGKKNRPTNYEYGDM